MLKLIILHFYKCTRTHARTVLFLATGRLRFNNCVTVEALMCLQCNYNGTGVFPLSLQSQCFSVVSFCAIALPVLATGNYHALLTYLTPLIPSLSIVHYNYRISNGEDKC